LASEPVSFYAAVFFLVNVTYIFLIWDLIDRTPVAEFSPAARTVLRVRSIATLCLFGVAAVVALIYPLVGLGICCCCLIVYLNPDAPGGGTQLPGASPIGGRSAAIRWLRHIRHIGSPRP